MPRTHEPKLNQELQRRFREGLEKKGLVRFELKATPSNKIKIKQYAESLELADMTQDLENG